MREEALKLEKVKKSCKTTAKVAQVLEIIVIVAFALCIVGAVICFCTRNEIDNSMIQIMTQTGDATLENGYASFDTDTQIGGLLSFSFNSEKLIEAGEYGLLSAVYCLMGAILCAVAAAIFDLIRRIFKLIMASETPFDEGVLKKIKVLFIIICVAILVTSGLGEAVLAALILRSIYTILDYGFTLQKQVDETI